MQQPLFKLGKTVITPNAVDAADKHGAGFLDLLLRHIRGDYSEMSTEDQEANLEAIKNGGRVFSAYTINGCKFWVITEADRSATTILLPLDY